MNKTEKIQKELSKDGHVVKRASDIKILPKERTQIFGLDYVLDGGISVCEGGHRIEFFGAESTAKTTFALYVAKQYQQLQKTCVFIDAEQSYEPEWGEKIGVDNNNLLISKPDTLEEAGDLFVKLIPETDLIIVDSLVSLMPIGEVERATDEPQVALQARVNSLICKKILHVTKERAPNIIFINQQRKKIGVRYGNPDTTAGGMFLRHLYNTRIEFKVGKPIHQGTGEKKEIIGNEIRLFCKKNKRGVPFRRTTVDFYLNGYIDNKKSLFYAVIKFGLIEMSGKTYTFKDTKIVGKDNFIEGLKDKDWKKIEGELWKLIK